MLTNHEIGLLYEIYEITFRDDTVVADGRGRSRLQPDIYSKGLSIRERLNESIAFINASLSQEERVRTILQDFEELSLDPSPIDQQGYSLRPNKNIKNLRNRLYPYTGILYGDNDNNKLLIG